MSAKLKRFLGGIAYSYIRFSTPDQLEGDSLRRQTEAAREWCERNGVQLDTQTTFRDLGRSGFTGAHLKNPELGGLATFLAMVEAGKIPQGSFLVCENADRLTRQSPWDAIGLFHKLVEAGIRIVLLSPTEQIIDQDIEPMQMVFLFLELSRGHGESNRKRELVGKNWQRWKKTAGETKEYRPGKHPFWLDRKGNGYALNQHAETVKLIFKLAADGWGQIRIARKLKEEAIRPIKQDKLSDGWISPAYMKQGILKNPAVYGRCEELDCDDYFPAVITREEFYRVQNILSNRNKGGGGKSNWVHLLKGLVQHRKSKVVYYPYKPAGCKTKVYIPSDYQKGGDTPVSCFPVHALEQAICSCVRELDWSKLFAGGNREDEKIASLTGEIEELKANIAEAQQAMDQRGKQIASVVVKMGEWEDRITELEEQRAQLRIKSSSPKAELFPEVQQLLKKLKEQESTELRLKGSALIAQVIERIEVEFRGKGKWRYSWCRVFFKDTDSYRDVYILWHKPHRITREETKEYLWWDHNKMVADADPTSAEDVFAFLAGVAQEVDSERAKERRERKRLVSGIRQEMPNK